MIDAWDEELKTFIKLADEYGVRMLKMGRLVLLTSAVTSIQFALRYATIKSLGHLRGRNTF